MAQHILENLLKFYHEAYLSKIIDRYIVGVGTSVGLTQKRVCGTLYRLDLPPGLVCKGGSVGKL